MMELHFIRPWWFLALLPLVILAWRLWRQTSQKGAWSQIIAPPFQTLLLTQNAEHSPKHWPIIGLGILWLITIITLSGPSWKQVKMPVETSLQGSVIVMDLSLSMLADDLKPNRLSRAQFKLQDLLKQHPELAKGMVVYAGTAHTLVPISQDNQTLLNLLPNLSPIMMPLYGSDPLQGFKLAKTLLDGAQVKQGHIIWVTDDVDDAQLEDIQDFFAQNNFTLAIYAVGTELGGPVQIPEFGLLKDDQGRIILPQVPLERLQKLANQLNSPMQRLAISNEDIKNLLPPSTLTTQEHQKALEKGTEAENPYLDAWIEEGLVLLWLLVPLAALGFRRGWLLSWLALPMSLSLINPIQPLYADEPTPKAFYPELLTGKKDPELSFTDAFITPDRQGYLLWEKEDYARAEIRFESPAWKGASLYKLGQYAKAAQQFALDKTPQGFYNQGNALAQQGQFDAAKTAYQTALEKQPDFAAAQHNLALMEKLLENAEQDGMPDGSNAQKQQQSQKPSNDLSDKNSGKDPNDKNSQQQSKQDQANNDNKPEKPSDQSAGETPEDNAQENADQNKGSEDAQQQGQADETRSGDQNAQEGGQQAGQDNLNNPVEASDTEQSLSESDENGENPSKLGDKTGQSEQTPNQGASKPQEGKTEQQQATQTWLNQIPDDPQLFLKRKFDYQFQQQAPASKPDAAQKIW